MKFSHLLGLAAVLLAGAVFTVFAQDEDIRYFEVKKPFENIYVRMDPTSEIIRQTRKGEYLELLTKGDSWCKVRVDGKDGFLVTRAGREVNKKGNMLMYLLYVIMLVGCAGGTVYYIKKQQKILSK